MPQEFYNLNNMKKSLENYRKIVGDKIIYKIFKAARKIYDAKLLHINSTYLGGGVAELLKSLVPLMNSIGIETDWRTLHGSPDFFMITKKFHNALQGDKINLTNIKKKIYEETNEEFSTYCHINHDLVIIHDPQPLPLIKFYKKNQPWIWRCHIDISNPYEELWDYLKGFILRYDLIVISTEKYKRDDLPMEQIVIPPGIDPLSPKNMDLPEEIINKYLKKYGIPIDKPIIAQIARFDKWKDPKGVIEVFKIVKKHVDCRLVLCGSFALDDPESQIIYDNIRTAYKKYIDNKDIILITTENNILVNAIQRYSSVIIHKSIREGFGLAVTEALWKSKPVVASNVGGIPLQIIDEKNGFLLKPDDIKGFANKIIYLLENRDVAEKMGKEGKKIVKEKFLITRYILDWLYVIRKILEEYDRV